MRRDLHSVGVVFRRREKRDDSGEDPRGRHLRRGRLRIQQLIESAKRLPGHTPAAREGNREPLRHAERHRRVATRLGGLNQRADRRPSIRIVLIEGRCQSAHRSGADELDGRGLGRLERKAAETEERAAAQRARVFGGSQVRCEEGYAAVLGGGARRAHALAKRFAQRCERCVV